MIFCCNFLSLSTKKNHRGTLQCFRNFVVSKKIWINRVGGISRFSVRKVLSHSTEKNRTGIFQCFTDSGIEKFFALEG